MTQSNVLTQLQICLVAERYTRLTAGVVCFIGSKLLEALQQQSART